MKNKNVVVKPSGHCRMSLSEIYKARRCQMKDQPSGMTPLFNHGGFTLIELLVVVLIIGILAAVALPQYQVAVVKSRVGSILNLLKTITEAQELYYLAHGEYADKLNKLDIDIPSSCSPIRDDSNESFKCDNGFMFTYHHNNAVNASYCPNNNHNLESCLNARDFLFNFRLLHRTQEPESGGKRSCSFYNESALGKKICSRFRG